MKSLYGLPALAALALHLIVATHTHAQITDHLPTAGDQPVHRLVQNGAPSIEDLLGFSALNFDLSPDMVTVGPAAGFTSFDLSTNCNSWTISWAPNWLIVSPNAGTNNSTVTIQYQENPSATPRSAVLVVNGCGTTATFTIVQNGTGPACAVPSNLTADYIHYSVFSLTWDSMPNALAYQTRIRLSGASSWLMGNWDSDNEEDWINMLPNTLYECQVRDSCANGVGPWSSVYTLTTLGASDPYCYSFGTATHEWIQSVTIDTVVNNSGNNLGYRNFTNISANVKRGETFSMSITPGTNNGTDQVQWRIWIDLNKDNDFKDAGEGLVVTSGTDQTTLDLSVPIPQSAAIGLTRMRIMMGTDDIDSSCNLGNGFWDVEDYALNIQPGITLDVSPDTFLVSGANGTVNLNITSNCPIWSVSNLPMWISANPSSGSNSAVVNLNYEQNSSPNARSVTFNVIGCGINREVTIIQSGASPFFNISPNNFNLPAASGWSVFNIQSNCSGWSISGVPSWLMLTPSSGNNNGTIVMQYDQNPSTFDRSAVLTVSGCGISQVVTVTQKGVIPTLEVSPQLINVSETAGNTAFSINTNCANWQITGAPSWVQLSANTGGNSATINVSYDANMVPSNRSAKLTIQGCGITRNVQINQEAFPLEFNIAPSALNVGSDAGIFSFALQTNCPNWSIDNVPSWLDVSPTSGSDTTIILVQCDENAIAVPRNALLEITACGATESFSLSQSAAPLSISVNPLALDFKETVDTQSLSLSINCDWSISYAPAWLSVTPDSGSGAATLTVIAEENTDASPRTDSIVIDACNGFGFEKIPVLQAGTAPPPAPWLVDSTGVNHTIVVPDDVLADFLGNPLENGDRIGVFYDSLGVLSCAGYMVWTGNTTAFTVYGNDASAPAVNGFQSDELFKWKIWRTKSNQVLDAQVEYQPVGTGGIVSHTGNFAPDGISMLSSITALTTVVHNLSLAQGWNMISSHVLPLDADMLAIFDQISDDIIIVKDGLGISTIPSLNINNIGQWEIKEGYQVKTQKPLALQVIGDKVKPQSHPIDLKQGWQIIAYLRDKPQDAQEVFSSITGDIEIVKDNAGKSYIPGFNINGIGLMYPGRGYQVKAINPVTLTYAANLGGSVPPADARPFSPLLQHFVLDSLNTGNNATLVIPAAVVGTTLQPGDEVGVFTPNGILCGAAIYAGNNLAITVWGDDATTMDEQEGMLVGDEYVVHVWLASQQLEYTTTVAFDNSDGLYQPDDLEVLSALQLLTTGTSDFQLEQCYMQPFPNPAVDFVSIDLKNCTFSEPMDIEIWSLDGRLVQQWSDQRAPVRLQLGGYLSEGVYLLKARTGSTSILSKLIIAE